jgi:hypothetical protein
MYPAPTTAIRVGATAISLLRVPHLATRLQASNVFQLHVMIAHFSKSGQPVQISTLVFPGILVVMLRINRS